MNNVREMKRRISFLKSTSQITRAMEMASALKLKHSEELVLNALPYFKVIKREVERIAKPDLESIYIKAKKVEKVCIIIVAPSKGFVGALIPQLIKETRSLKENILRIHPKAKIESITLHKNALTVSNKLSVKSVAHFAQHFEEPKIENLYPIIEKSLTAYLNGDFQEVYIVYSEYVNALKQISKMKKLLPIEIHNELHFPLSKFEPDVLPVAEFLFKEFFESKILFAVLNSNASENAARMLTMKNATDNAKDLRQELITRYNKERQTQVTQQMIEIMNGVLV